MEWFAFFFPLLATVVLLVFWRQRVVWWEIALLLGLSALVLLIGRTVMVSVRTSDTEYLGSYTVRIEYYEAWNEYIHKTCENRTCTGSGKDEVCTTTTYDCSYVQEHDEEWHKIDQLGNDFDISKSEYDQLARQFGTKAEFVELNRDYHTEDGDEYLIQWNGDRSRLDANTWAHGYENKIQASHSIFRLREVSPQIKQRYGLYDYPAINGTQQLPVLSHTALSYPQQVRPYEIMNAVLGHQKQVRVFVLLFHNQPREAGIWQEHYWEGGNKNELVICLGLNGQGQVTWTNTFAWEDNPLTELKIRDLFLSQGALDLARAATPVEQTVLQHWKRKQFADYNYLQVELTGGQVIGLYVLIALLTLGIAVWVVLNGIDSVEQPTDPWNHPRNLDRIRQWPRN